MEDKGLAEISLIGYWVKPLDTVSCIDRDSHGKLGPTFRRRFVLHASDKHLHCYGRDVSSVSSMTISTWTFINCTCEERTSTEKTGYIVGWLGFG